MGHVAQGHQQMLRLDDESRHPLRPETIEQVFSFAAERITSVQGLVISDYAKGALPPELLNVRPSPPERVSPKPKCRAREKMFMVFALLKVFERAGLWERCSPSP